MIKLLINVINIEIWCIMDKKDNFIKKDIDF